ncbi:MAG: transcriptional regulator NrdR [Treponema sp.]|nr:MAG: transcriptional regulator NrdR [Treponema sp.]
MRCPHCRKNEDRVIESRTLAQGDCIRRRRECVLCGYRFTSYERIEEKPLMIVKRDGRREPFDAKKIEKGLERALEKRPVSRFTIENLMNEIEDQAMMLSEGGEISSSVLGEMVLANLSRVDKVAYIRFASVYRKFNDLDEFIQEVKKIDKEI